MGLWDLADSLVRFFMGRRVPVTEEQLGPYKNLRETLTGVYRVFRITRGLSPGRDREKFINRRTLLHDANVRFYTELTDARTILDESHVEIFDSLVDEVFYYLGRLEIITNVGIEEELRLRQSYLNELEERLDDRFIVAEATIRMFLLGFSFKAWWKMRKFKSRRK